MSKRGVGIGLIAIALFMLLGMFNSGSSLGAKLMIFAVFVVAPGAFGAFLIKKHYSPEWDPAAAGRRMWQERKRPEPIAGEVELAGLRGSLETGFTETESKTGLKSLRELSHEYDELLPGLTNHQETDPFAVAQIPALAERTYRQGLSVLNDALELHRAISTSSPGKLEAEIAELEEEIKSFRGSGGHSERISLKKATIASHRKRLELVSDQQLHLDRLFFQSEQCEASLHETRIQLAVIHAGRSKTSVESVTGTLQRTIDQAKEVQEELKRLGF